LKKQLSEISALFLISIFLFGCGTTGKLTDTGSDNKGNVDKPGIINENYDPQVYNDKELIIKKTISPESNSENIDNLLFQADGVEDLPEEIEGFRVQICAVSGEEQAKRIQRDAIIQFIDKNVYLKYDSPYYKVRIGDCATRYEAEQLLKLASKKGFADAWVVRSKIKRTTDQKQAPPPEENKPPN